MEYCSSSKKKKINLKTKQHICIEFCIRLERIPNETIARGWFIDTSVLPSRDNSEYYVTILKQLLAHIRRKCLELVSNWILH